MRIQHSVTAMTANRFFKNNGRLLKRDTEELSTGYRVNCAADDAAGLTISEKMRGQIRGLNRASSNIQEGISLIQTAEGALQETHSILQRMRELSVQAANDTYVLADREAIQEEMDQLTAEVDRIANHTEYNNGIYPLLGGGASDRLENYLIQRTLTYTTKKSCTVDDVAYNPGDSISVTCVFFDYAVDGYKGCGRFFLDYTTSYTPGKSYADIVDIGDDDGDYGLISSDFNSFHSMTLKDWGVDDDERIYSLWRVDSNNYEKKYIIWKYESQFDNYRITATYDKNDPDIIRLKHSSSNSNSGRSNLWIQAGANANQGINISLVDATAAGIGLNDVSVLSSAEAGKAIQTVDDAISQVSRYRSDFGAQQNRLEHAMAVDDNTAENLQVAESRIRDLDMADEIVKHTKLTMMGQFMQTILANANSQPESVLALLS